MSEGKDWPQKMGQADINTPNKHCVTYHQREKNLSIPVGSYCHEVSGRGWHLLSLPLPPFSLPPPHPPHPLHHGSPPRRPPVLPTPSLPALGGMSCSPPPGHT